MIQGLIILEEGDQNLVPFYTIVEYITCKIVNNNVIILHGDRCLLDM